MTKTAATTTINPSSLSLGAPVLAESVKAAVEQLNWSFSQRPQSHLSWCSGGAVMAAGAPELCGPVSFGTDYDDEIERIRARIWINPDVLEVHVSIRCIIDTGAAVDVLVDVGGDSHEFDLDDGDTDTELTHVFSTEDTGTGWQTVTVKLVAIFATTADCYLVNFHVRDLPIDEADLPSPT